MDTRGQKLVRWILVLLLIAAVAGAIVIQTDTIRNIMDEDEDAIVADEGTVETEAEPPEAEPPEAESPEPEAPSRPTGLAEEAVNDTFQEQLDVLREELRQLRERFEQRTANEVAALQQENAQLREELRRAYTLLDDGGLPGAVGIPRPGAAMFDAIREEALTATPEPNREPNREPFTIVEEWGRTPEAAASLSPDVSSLKGLVAHVPPRRTLAELEELGRTLRAENAHYDNINIEVFDDADAARKYAQDNSLDNTHRVLTVSKHKASNRDIIILHQAGKEIEVKP